MIASNRRENPFPFSIIRLWPQHHKDPAELNELLAALKRNRHACDEVWYATEIGLKRNRYAEEILRRERFFLFPEA
jgi:hypothetical protein